MGSFVPDREPCVQLTHKNIDEVTKIYEERFCNETFPHTDTNTQAAHTATKDYTFRAKYAGAICLVGH